MVTSPTLPSGDATAGPGAGTEHIGPDATRVLDAVVVSLVGDLASGPAIPPIADVTSLVIDLTDELADALADELTDASVDELVDESGREPGSVICPGGRQVLPGELVRTAAIHAGQLPDGFFVGFGARFLTAYHATFLAGPYATALAVGPPGAPLGFVVGTSDNPRHYQWLVRNAGPLARSGATALSLRPRLAYRVLRTRGRRYARGVLRLLRQRPGTAAPERRDVDVGGSAGGAPTVVAVLTHLAVAPDAQGTGLGRVLVESFVADVRAQGADEIRLIAHVQTPAPGFYRRLGWSSLGERTGSDGSLVEEFRFVL